MRTKNHQYEVIVIGAGAAGLSCALKLKQAGVDFLLLEARSRVGGRAFSENKSNSVAAVELGAEFIHGAPKSTLEILEKLNISFYDVLDDHYFLQNKKLKLVSDYWTQLEVFMKAVKARKVDISITDFLSSFKSKNYLGRAMFKSYVEGFQGADLDETGTRALALAEETEEGDEINDAQLFRPAQSYQAIFERMLQLFETDDNVNFETVLKNVNWAPRKVLIDCVVGPLREEVKYRARKLIITVPVGVLKSNQIKWNQKPNALDKILGHLKMAHIQKITFCFRERFWEELTKKPLAFFHVSTDHDFPTWWTYQPLRCPYLVAWQGGPKGQEMAHWSNAQKVAAALKTLSFVTGFSGEKLNSMLISAHTHNWSEDVYSLGAYSYISKNGVNFAKKLATPVDKTIYFAGEGTVMGPGRGTIHGALISGERAARLVLD